MKAAIGNDGTRPVVWGLGRSYDDAMEDAAEQDGCPQSLVVVDVTDEQAERVEAGEVSTEALGVSLTPHQISQLA